MNHSPASPDAKALKWLSVLRAEITSTPRKGWLPKVIGSYRQQPDEVAYHIVYACLRETGFSVEFFPDDNLAICHQEERFYLLDVHQYIDFLNPDDLVNFGEKVFHYQQQILDPPVRGLFIHSGKVRGLKNIPDLPHVQVISGNTFVDLMLNPRAALTSFLTNE